MYYKICIALVFLATTLAFPQKKDNLDELISDIFGPKKPTTEAPTSSVSLDGTLEDMIDKIFNDDDSKTKTTTTTTTKRVEYLAKTDEDCVNYYLPGICTPYYKCEKEVNNNEGLIDIAGGQDIICESYLDVCCRTDGIIANIKE